MEFKQEEYIKHLEKTNIALIEANKESTKEFQKTFRLMLVVMAIMLVLICMFTFTLSLRGSGNNTNLNYNGGRA